MTIRKSYQLLLLCFLVLTLYYPTLSAEVSLVDDQEMLNGMFNSDSISFADVFLPKTEKGGYYRPFIGLSYYLDNILWGLNLRSMHLDNVVMHLVNVLLLFYITHLATSRRSASNRYLPFAAASLFAFHPIATESVNWISGRTDPMAANFVLVATALLLLYRSSGLKRYFASAIFFTLLGILSKEAAFGMIPAIWFILAAEKIYKPIEQSGDELLNDLKLPFDVSGLPVLLCVFAINVIEVLYIGNYWFVLISGGVYYFALLYKRRSQVSLPVFNLKSVSLLVGCLVLSAALYLALRKIAFSSDAGKIGQTLTLMMLDTNYCISLFLGAVGFYFKKFIVPLPLNFYILEVDALYDLVGILLLLVCLRLFTRLNLAVAFFMAGFCMLVPVLPFAFGTIAWTGYAERYLYISTAFWIISGVIYIDANPPSRRFANTVYIGVITTFTLFFVWQTYLRNVVWQKNVTLLEDTLNQTPKAGRVREMYMYALYQAGNIDAAKQQYAILNPQHLKGHNEAADIVMARILTSEGKLNEALELYESVIKVTKYPSAGAIKRLARHLEIMLNDEKDPVQRARLMEKIRDCDLQLGKMSTDPMLLYRLGQKALASNDKKSALDYFVRANRAFPMSSPYKAFSAKLITHLKQDLL